MPLNRYWAELRPLTADGSRRAGVEPHDLVDTVTHPWVGADHELDGVAGEAQRLRGLGGHKTGPRIL